jgi:hypothetical protein
MVPSLHKYHLDDAPDLASCCILARDVTADPTGTESVPLTREELVNFYGRNNPLRYRYVRDTAGLNRGRAADQSYNLEPLELT